MSTKNHKPATTSDILPADAVQDSHAPRSTLHASDSSPTNPQVQKSPNPFPLRGRCGKVARLPKEIRDQLNEMLLDGIPHHQIIQKLQAQFGPQPNLAPLDFANSDASSLAPSDGERAGERGSSTAPESSEFSPNVESSCTSGSIENPKSKIENLDGLTPRHITNWKKFGGYRDWLRDQQRIEECRLRHELTLDLARSAEGLASYQAAPKVAVAQICQTIIDLGPEGLKEAMQATPLNCFRLLNALARLINSGLKCEQQIQKTAIAANNEKRGVDSARWARFEKNLNLL